MFNKACYFKLQLWVISTVFEQTENLVPMEHYNQNMNHIEWLVFCLFREEIFKNWQIDAELSKIPWKIRVAIAPCLFTNLVGIHPRIMSTYDFKNIYNFNNIWPFWDTSVVSMSASYGRLRVRARLGHTKDHYKNISSMPFSLTRMH